MNIKALGLKIKGLRESAGLTMEKLASQSGVAKNAILAIEKGRGNPTIGTLEAVASALELTLSQLLGADVKPRA